MPDEEDRLAPAERRLPDVARRGARREPVVDLRCAEPESLRRLACAEQGARHDRVGLERELPERASEPAGLLAAAGCQRA
jgi:hypothetical protein